MTSSSRDAATLVYKAMAIHSNPYTDAEYRQLLARCRAEREFAELVHGIAEGMSLIILDISDRGLVVAPSGKESRFSIKVSDFRSKMPEEQKVAVVLAHLTIGAVFYPTADFLDDDGRTPFPATVGIIRDKLLTIAMSLERASMGDSYSAEETRPGWTYLLGLPAAIPNAERASMSSIEGIIRVCLSRMLEYGLVRKEGKEDIDEQTSFTPTHQLRIQLRELTLPTLFKAVVEAAATKTEG